MNGRLLLVCLGTCLCLNRPLRAEDTGTLIDKVLQAHGGAERVKRAAVVRETGRVDAALRMGNSGPLLRVFESPERLRVEVGPPGEGREIRVLDSGKAWRNGHAVTGAAYDAMVLQALRLDLLRHLMNEKSAWREKHELRHEGKSLRVLELKLDRGMFLDVGIDRETDRIVFSSGLSANLPSGPMSFETYYSDFREVDGILFAFKEENMAGGIKTAETILTNIELLPKAPAGAFKP